MHSVSSCLCPAGPTTLWEQLLSTLLVMLPVQPPPEGSEIKWSAELETLLLLVRQLDFTNISRCAVRCFPIFVLRSFCLRVSPANQAVEDMQTTLVVPCPALVMENLFLKSPWLDLSCHTWNKVCSRLLTSLCFSYVNSADLHAFFVFSYIFSGKSAVESSQLALQYMGDRVRGAGGVVVVSPSGQWAAEFTTVRMSWAAVDKDNLWYGLDPGERLKEALPH